MKLLHETIRAVVFCFGALASFPLACPAAADTNAGPDAASKALTYDECVRLGLQQSPMLKKSAIEVDIRRLTESDMKWDYLPSVYINTSYYVTKPDYTTSDYDTSFSTGPYDLIQPYFGIRAAKEFTRIAVLAHLQTIAEGLHEIGKIFLQVDAAEQTLAVQDDIIRLAGQNKAQSEALADSPNNTALDRQITARELEEARIEKERLLAVKSAITDRLLALIGASARDGAIIATSNAYAQVVGSFVPEQATLQIVSAHSTELQIREIQKRLQDLNISAAYAKYIPSPVISMRTADPLQNTSDNNFYLTVGINFQIWDGLDRSRNVTRQKNVLRQMEMDFENASQNLKQTWVSASNQCRIALLDFKLAAAQEEINRLKKEQNRISHESGTLPAYMLRENQAKHLVTRKLKIARKLDYDLSILYMRHLSGNLRDSYIDQKDFSVELREGSRKGQAAK